MDCIGHNGPRYGPKLLITVFVVVVGAVVGLILAYPGDLVNIETNATNTSEQ